MSRECTSLESCISNPNLQPYTHHNPNLQPYNPNLQPYNPNLQPYTPQGLLTLAFLPIDRHERGGSNACRQKGLGAGAKAFRSCMW